jgi:hypothetical protein
MTPEILKERAKPLLGGRGWRKRLAVALGVDYATVKRWTADGGKVPIYVQALLECLEALAAAGQPLPDRFKIPADSSPAAETVTPAEPAVVEPATAKPVDAQAPAKKPAVAKTKPAVPKNPPKAGAKSKSAAPAAKKPA